MSHNPYVPLPDKPKRDDFDFPEKLGFAPPMPVVPWDNLKPHNWPKTGGVLTDPEIMKLRQQIAALHERMAALEQLFAKSITAVPTDESAEPDTTQ